MSSNDQNAPEAETNDAGPTDSANGPALKQEEGKPTKPSTPFFRKLRVFGAALLLVVIIILLGAGTYPYWRGEARMTLNFLNLNIRTLEHIIGVPQWMIDHGRESGQINGQQSPTVIASEQTSRAELEEKTPYTTYQESKPHSKSEAGYVAEKKGYKQTASRRVSERPDAPDNEQKMQTTANALASRMRGFEDWVLRLEGQLTGMNTRIAELEDELRLQTPDGTGEPFQQIYKLSEKVAALDSAIAEMKAIYEEQETKIAPEGMISTMVSLAERITAIETQVQVDNNSIGAIRNETSAVGSRLSVLNEQVTMLDALIKRANPAREQAALLLMSVNQLAIVAARGDPFVTQLKSIRAIAHGTIDFDDAIGRLEPHASKGTATLVTLRSQFTAVAMTAIRARDVGTSDGLVGEILTRIASLVTIRKVEAPSPGSVDKALAAADTALTSGDLSAAVSALRSLDGATGAAIESWLSDATDRLAVNRGIADLQAVALAALSAAG